MSGERQTERTRTCPTCKKRFVEPTDEAARRALPFCTPRCKMADLGRWLGGEYALPSEERPSDEELELMLRHQAEGLRER